jgi:hypothetical protein
MTQYATVTALPTGPRTLDLGVGVRFLADTELAERTGQYGLCSGLISDKRSGAIHDKRWFPDKTVTPDAARAACAGCPVIAECLEKALRRPELHNYGIFGGTTPEDRKAMTRTQRRRLRGYAVVRAELDAEEVAS